MMTETARCLIVVTPDLPDGQISKLPVQFPLQKFSALPVGQIISTSPRHPVPVRGAFRDRHERWVRDAVDAKMRETKRIGADGEVV
jgi:hypothetical protein